MTSKFTGRGVYNILPTARALINCTNWHSRIRHPSDVLFTSTLSIQNAVVGSRYWIARAVNEAVIDSGTVVSSSFEVGNIAVYENPMLVKIRLRNSSGASRYVPYETYAYVGRSGATAYISQILDVI